MIMVVVYDKYKKRCNNPTRTLVDAYKKMDRFRNVLNDDLKYVAIINHFKYAPEEVECVMPYVDGVARAPIRKGCIVLFASEGRRKKTRIECRIMHIDLLHECVVLVPAFKWWEEKIWVANFDEILTAEEV